MFQLKTKAIIILILLLCVLSSLMVYGQAEEKMDMYGKITKIVYDEHGKLKEVHVENINEDKKPYDKTVVIISENTEFIKGNFELSNLQEGQILGIIFKQGPITMIYPARVEAKIIRIKDSAAKVSTENEDEILPANDNQRIVEKDRQESIMQKFNDLLQMEKGVKSVLDFINNNISIISEEKASQMISEFENLQRNHLSRLEEQYYDNDLQKKIYKTYQNSFDLSKINDINELNKLDDHELKELLVETRNSGYKVETAEGMFFPIINYQFYQQYSTYLTTDMEEYVRIMSVESDQVPAKDAALVVGWNEVVNRALSQEEFIIQYPDSIKLDNIKELYNKYLTFIFYGLNNTPLFSYDLKMIETEAWKIYSELVKSNQARNSSLLESLNQFLKLLERNDYKLTDEVKNYRKRVVEDIISSYNYTENNLKEIIAAMQNDINILKENCNGQKIHESNYGDSTQLTQVLKISDSEIQFEAVNGITFSGNFKGHYTAGKSYPYYLDAAMGGQRGINVKDDFGVWYSFSYHVNIMK